MQKQQAARQGPHRELQGIPPDVKSWVDLPAVFIDCDEGRALELQHEQYYTKVAKCRGLTKSGL